MIPKDDFLSKFEGQMQNFYAEFAKHENIFRFNDLIFLMTNNAKEYALFAMKQLTYINGGALIVLPTMVQAFQLKTNQDLYIAAYFYAGGLTLIILCALFAYFSASAGIMVAANERNRSYSEGWIINLNFLTLKIRYGLIRRYWYLGR